MKQYYRQFNCIIPDGQSIAFAAPLLNRLKIQYISGAEFMVDLLRLADEKHYSIYFLSSLRKELFIQKYKDRLFSRILMGVGVGVTYLLLFHTILKNLYFHRPRFRYLLLLLAEAG